jgi:hypothetical protein
MRRFRPLIHRAVAVVVALFNRNPWTYETLEFVPRSAYKHDQMLTAHNHSFMNDPRFQRAYARAVKTAGWDYQIYWRVHVILWAAATAAALDGDFVECGTGRGFMASAICESLSWAHRPFYLLDTFESGLVKPDSSHRQSPSGHYATGADEVRKNFLAWPGVELVVGMIPKTLQQVDSLSVAFLHLDMNHPDPEVQALRHFWPKLASGGMVVFDDYAMKYFEPVHEAHNRVAEDLGFSILSLPTGQGIAIKP